jgi:hypothetical protein
LRPSLERLDQRQLLTGGPLGMNAGIPMYGDEFVDMIKSSSGFFSPSNDPNYKNDAQGWPEADATAVIYDQGPITSWAGADTSVPIDWGDDYHLSFHGKADISFAWADVQDQFYDPATDTTTATVSVPHDSTFLQLYLSNTRRTPDSPVGSGVTDVRLIQPGYDPNTTQLFSTPYLNALKPFDTLRYMDDIDVNNYGPEWVGRSLEWSQRPLPDQASQVNIGPVASVPWEDLIQLSNATHTNMWINIPGPASDDYVRQLADLIQNGDTVDGVTYPGLDPGLEVYVEWSNEAWGGSGPPYWYAAQTLQDEGVDPGAAWYIGGEALLQEDLTRTMQIADIFDQVFNDPDHDTIRPVVVGQEQNYQVFEQTLPWFESTYGAPSEYFYGIGQANYYGPSDYSSVDNIINETAAAAQQDNQATLDFTTLATYYGLKNVAYEGGPAMGATGTDGQTLLQALHDPRMEQVVEQSYIDWFANGGDQAEFYGGPYGGWNAQWPWGAAPTGYENDPSQSPKYAGLMDVIHSGPIPVTAGIAVSGSAPTTFDANTDTLGNWFNSNMVFGNENGYWLLRVDTPGTYDLTVSTGAGDAGQPKPTPVQISTSGDTGLGPEVMIPTGGGTTDLGQVTLHAGLNTLYVHTPSTAWGFGANTFTLTPIPQVGDAGFESPSVGGGGYQYDPAGSPWAFSGDVGGSGLTGNASGFTGGNPDAPEGAQVAFLQAHGTISQQVANWAAGSYILSFQAAQRVDWQASQQDFRVLVDDNVVGTFTPSSTGYATYTTAPFTVGAGSHTITFQGRDSAGGDNTAFLDDVRLVPA